LSSSTVAPSPANVWAATWPVPEVVPVMATVLPAIEGSDRRKAGKCTAGIWRRK
jgi:hypothetical protein